VAGDEEVLRATVTFAVDATHAANEERDVNAWAARAGIVASCA